ncbi:amino acid adenylation domain-containing protein [Roseibacillus persicicus]|uniref:amino acid adenylation domain-containing protein n=1 Tax=Roseibacillus persicicus TaxID=454148 RepID=UPI00398A8D46
MSESSDNNQFTLEVSATFTAEPLAPVLDYWFQRLGIETSLRFAPYNQVFQSLLDPASPFHRNTGGLNVILLRPEDWQRFGSMGTEEWQQELRKNSTEFIAALRSQAAPHPGRYLIILTEPSEEVARDPAMSALVNGLCNDIAKSCLELRIPAVTGKTLANYYPTSSKLDPIADREGHLPYTDAYYQSLATLIARRVHSSVVPSPKVLVLDADNTLWPGVAAEIGAEKLEITPPFQALQRFIKSRKDAGLILCLASKNEEDDVREVFRKNSGMILREDDIVGWKVNWQSKSSNIAALAEQLNLGLDSFVFLDDNPMEIAEVAASLPQVTVVELPQNPDDFADFLKHHWRLELPESSTSEDSQRTAMYQTMLAREEVREQSADYETFLHELQLEISFSSLTNDNLARVAQLSQRTNQFNTTTIRRNEDEVTALPQSGKEVLAVEVKDRFGDYGLVGVVVYEVSGNLLTVDSLLLSCRVLGKGVEQKIIARLTEIARQAGVSEILIPLRPNERNTPARQFLEQIGAGHAQSMDDEVHFRLPLAVAEQGAQQPVRDTSASLSPAAATTNPTLISSQEYRAIALRHRVDEIGADFQEKARRRPELSELFAKPMGATEEAIASLWSQVLHLSPIGRHDRFADLGGKSLQVIQLLAKLSRHFDKEVTAPELFQHSTVAEQAKLFTTSESTNETAPVSFESSSNRDIAIVGMSCRLPESPNVHQFWQNLLDGKECLTQLTDADLLTAGIDPATVRNDSGYVPVKGLMENVENFDAKFFGVLPNEAKLMDPQHRVFLELAWDCLEDAGYNSEDYEGKIGVWAGNYLDTYAISNLATDREFLADWIPSIQVGSLQAELGNDKDYLATRVAFKLDLRGPAMTVQSACSTSLVAITQACLSLRAGACDMALAGGVTITLPEKKGYYFTPDGILSQDGSCRTFDEKATGTVFSNGAGIVLLKRLDDAVRDGDHIHAVIKGCALNNDGGRKHSYTAPSIDGQAGVIKDAIADAGIDPSTITYVEAHGTGTPLGDPIEVAGLTKAFRDLGVTHKQGCAIGSVKPSVGHLDIASGVTATIKTAFSLEHGKLPATLHFQKANPKIDFENSPFHVNADLTDWQPDEGPRRAGISSFGVGGTNAHIILEEPPKQESSPSSRPYQLFPFSARSDEALAAMKDNLVSYCASHPDLNPADIAHTLRIGRKHFAKRQVLVGDSLNLEKARSAKGSPKQVDAPLVFMFPGQGSQTVGMGRDLYQSEPFFRSELDRCAEILLPLLGEDLRDTLFPAPEADQDAAAHRIKQTIMAQPAIFVLSYCQARLLMHWGMQPTALVGHSVGELVAATISGILSLEDALAILAQRGALMQAVEPGGMLSVRLSEEKLAPLIPERLDLAAVNGPELCVVAGPHDELEKFTATLAEQDIAAKPLHTSHGFHSWMMDEVIEPFQKVIERAALHPPQIPIRSTVTTEWLSDDQATDPHYWASHVRRTVRFTQAAAHFCEAPETTLLEVGPGQTLSTLSRQVADKKAKQAIFSTSGHATDTDSDALHFQLALGQLWIHGHTIDWEAYTGAEVRKRVPLPTYPFERKRFWIDPKPLTTEIPVPPQPSQPLASPAAQATLPQTVPPVMSTDRKPVIQERLCQVLNDLSGIEPEEMEADATLIELGFDSLMLTQVSKEIEKAFGVATTMRQLLAELPTIGDIVGHLDKEADPSQFQPAAAAPAPTETAPQQVLPQQPAQAAPQFAPVQQPFPTVGGDQGALMAQMMNMQMQQMQFMQQQMQMLAGLPTAPNALPTAPAPQAAAMPVAPIPSTPKQNDQPKEEPKSGGTASGTTTSITRDADDSLTTQQRQHLDQLISSYVARSKSSKEWTAKYRQYHADPRTVSGFNRSWKEMIYQLVVKRSKGSRLLDIDGNEYIDILNGFGPGFFGHSPDFVLEAVRKQMEEGFEVGPQSPLTGETAQLFCEMTGNERASFVCTGSEAVQAAMRLARTATGRDKIAVFTKDYHGNFDEVLLRGSQTKRKPRTFPSAPGVPKSAVSNMLVLDYGTDESLEILKEHAHELAAIMIEPVQSRRPEFQPHEFVKALRTVADEAGSLLIFDEVICGLRDGPHGAQGFYGVKSDISTYGKVIGGGLPIGIVAGKAKYMDTFDGGHWQYGDDSFPEGDVTFFAGTFVRHPLGIAAANAVLKHLKSQGPLLWANLNARAERLYRTVDQFMVDNEVPIRLPGLHSRFFVRVGEDCKYGNLLFFHLRKKGVFILEGFPSYITTAHTDEDIDYVIRAFKESVAELQAGGFLKKTDAIKLLDGPQLTGPPPRLSGSAPAKVTAPVTTESKQVPAPNKTENLPLTEAQQEIWLACQLGHEASCAFNEATSLVFEGSLDSTALEKALNTVVNHHDALRSSFDLDGDTWSIADRVEVPFRHQDLSGLSDEEKGEAIQLATQTQALTPFDLQTAPLLRAKLTKVSEDRHILFLTAHHIVADGWSFNVLIENLSDCYNAFSQGLPNPLEPSASFANYALQRAEHEQSGKPDPHLDYWISQYPDTVPILNLPTDRPFPQHRTFSGATLHESIDASLLKSLRKAGARSGATLYATTLSAFQILLHRLTGQSDLVIGIPAAGQSSQGLENMVGHCVNFLPLRAKVEENQPFSELVQIVAARVLEAYEHQDCTYGQLVPRLKLQRRPGRMPLTEVGFNLERMDYFKPFEGLETEFVDSPKSFVNQLLFLNLVESKNGVSIECHFNTAVFNHSTVEGWMKQYREILEGIANNPEGPSGKELPAPAPQAMGRPLPLSANNETDYPRTSTVQQLFEEVAATHPERTALQLRDWTMSYQTLNRLANRLAVQLRNAGIETNRPVPVVLDRSFDYIISILAVLKAGGAYLPVDPCYPQERIAALIESAQPKVILTRSSFSSQIAAPSQCKLIAVDEVFNDEDANDAGSANLPLTNKATDLAYIMFTSGSTGNPKGVEIPHRGIVRLVKNTNYAELDDSQVYLQASSLSFDASTFEIWAPLLNGGRLVLLPPGAPSLDTIAKEIRDHRVTTLWLTSGLFQLMVDEKLEALRPLKQLLAGGDVLSKHHVGKVLRELPNLRIINGYGPTENTTFSCCHTITTADLDGSSIPIGKPISNSEVYLLDEHLNPLPPMTEGELFFGGDGLARGYFENEKLTTERFITNPFSIESDSKLYRSGDRARYRPDGVIEFLGRVDEEVKIRGYRIDPSEIEEALCRHEAITQARVVARGESAEDKSLVAYVTSRTAVEEGEVKGFLQSFLPSHLIPARIVAMETLPVTDNGKVDDSALPTPEADSATAEQNLRFAESETEKRMAQLWSRVLKIDEVPANRSFFDLGGHSLQALKLFNQIEKEFGKKLPLSTLFESPTIEGLAARFAPKEPAKAAPANLTAIRKTGSKTPIFCIHGGDGGTLIYRSLAERVDPDRPFYTLEAPALSGESDIATTIEETAATYLEQIQTVQAEGPYLLGGYCFGGIVVYEIAQQLKAQGQEIELLCLFDTDNPAVAPRYLSLAERASRQWQESSEKSWVGKVGKLSGRFGEGLVNKLKVGTEKAAASVASSTGMDMGAKLQTVIVREAHDKAMQRYRPRSYDGDVVLFTAEDQGDGVIYPPHLGWDGYVRGQLELIPIPGEHLTIFQEPHVEDFAKELHKILSVRA